MNLLHSAMLVFVLVNTGNSNIVLYMIRSVCNLTLNMNEITKTKVISPVVFF